MKQLLWLSLVFASPALASGGAIESARLACTNVGQQLVVVHLLQAPSSQTIGDVAVYRGANTRSQMLTSMELCRSAAPTDTVDADLRGRAALVLCGSPVRSDGDAVGANRAGYEAMIWQEQGAYRARIKLRGQPALGGDLSCQPQR